MSNDLIALAVGPDGVATLTLDNPPLNLITVDLTSQLISAAEAVSTDPAIRALVITGAGTRAFCAGADITEFADVRDDVIAKKLQRENQAMNAIAALPIPTIAAIGGVALGGGGELCLACDLRVMDADAVIGFPEIQLGVFPGAGGVFRLPRIVGISNALRLLYSGTTIDAAEAHRMGLANEVASSGTALAHATELAALLAQRPALALKLIKEGAYAALTEDTVDATRRTLEDSDTVFAGPDIEEGIAAFLGKRSPHFTTLRSTSQQTEEHT